MESGSPSIRVMIVEVNDDGTIGGSHQVLWDVIRRLDRHLVEPVVAFYEDNPIAERLRGMGVSVIVLDDLHRDELKRYRSGRTTERYRAVVQAVRARVALLKRDQIDLVHINNSPQVAIYDWLPAARNLGIPIVASAMGDAGPITGRIRRTLVRSYNHYIAVSHYMYQALREQGVSESRISLVRNGVDVSMIQSRLRRSRGSVRRELGVLPHQLLGVMVGNVRRWKGQHVVLQALALLPPDKRSRLVVAFAGANDPSGLDFQLELQSMVDDWGLAQHTRWLGRRDDVPDLFRAADFGLHASILPEPFGLVMVECMATGTPVIASQEGGAAEIVTPETGWCYRGGDADELASLLMSLPLERAHFRRFAGTCRLRAEEFDARFMSQGVEDVYLRVSGGRRRWI